MTALAGRVLWVSLTTSAVLLPLLLLAGPICRRYRAKSCYILWLLLALRLLVPVEVPLPQPSVTVEIPVVELIVPETPQTQASPFLPSERQNTAVPPATQLGAGSPLEILALVWGGGAVLLLAAQWIRYSTVRRHLWNHSQEHPNDRRRLMELGAAVPVRRGDVEGPMTFGLLRPVIFLPRELPEQDVELVLRHEVCHLRRKDLWYKGLFLLCACVHWFNPLVWKLGTVAGEHLELCCDEDVVAGQEPEFRRAYGQLLLRSAAAGREEAFAARLGGSDLKGRIMNLFTKKKRGAALVCTVACAAVMMSSLVGCEVRAAGADPQAEPSIREEAVSNALTDLLEQSAAAPEEEPLLWPVEGEYTLSALHGGRTHPVTGEVDGHDGIDIIADGGTEVQAARSGVVIESAFDQQYGNYVLLAHEDGQSTLYAHMKESLVEENDTVAQGQVIGTVGKTGMATGEHLHFEMYQDSKRVDPLGFYLALDLELRMDGQNEPVKVEWPVSWN